MASEIYNAWAADVKAHNGMVTRWPPNKTPSSNAGALAARYGASRYELAPLTVRLLDGGTKIGDAVDIAKGDVANAITDVGDQIKSHLWMLYAAAAAVAVLAFVRRGR
jgi:hypothetical protein